MSTEEFQSFGKIKRLFRDCIITEKIDGTNAQIYINDSGNIMAGSRNRWLTPETDNFGFAGWVRDNQTELLKLGPGRHFGEWWGSGIQRKYGLDHKRFSLFNVNKWWNNPEKPGCCSVVPILYRGEFCTQTIQGILEEFSATGSLAAPGFPDPEGIVILHCHSNQLFKVTLDGDGHKGLRDTE